MESFNENDIRHGGGGGNNFFPEKEKEMKICSYNSCLLFHFHKMLTQN